MEASPRPPSPAKGGGDGGPCRKTINGEGRGTEARIANFPGTNLQSEAIESAAKEGKRRERIFSPSLPVGVEILQFFR